MLGKLLKYELKATGRIFLPLYAVFIIFTIINKLFITFNAPTSGFSLLAIPSVISMFIYVILIITIAVLTFVIMIQRFYKNLLSNEGYLMFTLPVKNHSHIFCKLITSLIWIVAGAIITTLSFVILAWSQKFLASIPQDFWKIPEEFFHLVGAQGCLYIIEFIILLFTNILADVLTIYLAMAIGHLAGKHRALASFGAFLGITICVQILASICIQILNVLDIGHWFSALTPMVMAHWILTAGTVINFVLCAVYFFVTNLILNKRLNLD